MGVVDEVKERIDVVEFISSYVPLKKAGRTYKGLCPFHAEKTPSFVVFPHTQTWHCFGACGTGGDVFSFLMQREGLSFSEALEQLARRAGVALTPPTAESEATNKRREKLLEMHATAARYFHHLLCQSAEGAVAKAYLAERSIDSQTVERFQLGYALDAWDGLKSHLLDRGYSEAEQLEGGLLVSKEESGRSYDRFRHRLIVPIRDRQGRVIAFGARVLKADDVPKYLNSPQTPLFDKGRTLFGLDMAKQAIREADQAVIVEGYMDVLSAHQQGHSNVVAGMGTALTEEQLRQVKRLTKHFVLALDADTAGSEATLRGISTARQALDRSVEPVLTSQGLVRFEGRLDVDIRIATLPAGRDPDDILRETPEEWPGIVDQALPVVSFYMQAVAAQHDLETAKGKSELVRAVSPLLREISDPVERAHYVDQLARLVKVDERVLLDDLERPPVAPRRPAPGGADGPAIIQEERGAFGPEEYLLASILRDPGALVAAGEELTRLGCQEVSADDFRDTLNQQLFLMVSKPEGAVAQADPVLQSHLDFLRERGERPPVLSPHLLPAELVSRVLRLRDQILQEELTGLRLVQREADESGDRQESVRYQSLVDSTRRRLGIVQRAMYKRSTTGRRREQEEREGLVRV
jgi:DNA primase